MARRSCTRRTASATNPCFPIPGRLPPHLTGRSRASGGASCEAAAVPTSVFVYGTLMPGHLRWEVLAPHAAEHRPASVDGVLWDTGRGWPALPR